MRYALGQVMAIRTTMPYLVEATRVVPRRDALLPAQHLIHVFVCMTYGDTMSYDCIIRPCNFVLFDKSVRGPPFHHFDRAYSGLFFSSTSIIIISLSSLLDAVFAMRFKNWK